MLKVRSRAKQSNAKKKEDCVDADSEIIQETQVNLPILPIYHIVHYYKTD